MTHLVSFGIIVVIWIKRNEKKLSKPSLWVYWTLIKSRCQVFLLFCCCYVVTSKFNYGIPEVQPLGHAQECCTKCALMGTYHIIWFPDFNDLFPCLLNITAIIPHPISFSRYFELYSPFMLPSFDPGTSKMIQTYSRFKGQDVKVSHPDDVRCELAGTPGGMWTRL